MKRVAGWLFLLILMTGLPLAVTAADQVPDDPDPLLQGLSVAEILRLGEQMYRNGILPSGEVMVGYVHDDIEIDGSAFSCASCHLRAGLGSYEGGVETPPTTGVRLYQPYRRPPSLHDVDFQGRYFYAKTILDRPAYTRDGIKHALRYGEDPTGEAFNEVMPRYPLGDRDLAILVRYLELLSRHFSPGATPTSFSFATIITDDVSPDERQALIKSLQRFIDEQNQQMKMYRNFIKSGYTPTGDMKYAFHSATLKIWDLEGPPESWHRQLERYLDRDRVFAVLGGISHQEWRPIHEFCEERRLPCLFPITDLPVVSADDWYTFYFNKGYFQEGAAAAQYLRRNASDAKLLQLVEDSPVGRALSEGFAAARRDFGLPEVPRVDLGAEQLQDPQALARLLAERQPDLVLLWGGPDLRPVLPALLGNDQRRRAFVSSTLLGREADKLPEAVRPQVLITWPYRLKPYVGDEEGTGKLARNPIEITWQGIGASRIASLAATMLDRMVVVGLRDLENDLYRDHLLDVISTQMDRVVFDFERISFGPGQRYVSKGCYVIQLGPGPQPELIPKSDWVIH